METQKITKIRCRREERMKGWTRMGFTSLECDERFCFCSISQWHFVKSCTGNDQWSSEWSLSWSSEWSLSWLNDHIAPCLSLLSTCWRWWCCCCSSWLPGWQIHSQACLLSPVWPCWQPWPWLRIFSCQVPRTSSTWTVRFCHQTDCRTVGSSWDTAQPCCPRYICRRGRWRRWRERREWQHRCWRRQQRPGWRSGHRLPRMMRMIILMFYTRCVHCHRWSCWSGDTLLGSSSPEVCQLRHCSGQHSRTTCSWTQSSVWERSTLHTTSGQCRWAGRGIWPRSVCWCEHSRYWSWSRDATLTRATGKRLKQAIINH